MNSINHFLLESNGTVINDTVDTKSGVTIYQDTEWDIEWKRKTHGLLAIKSEEFPEIPVGAKMYVHYLSMNKDNLIRFEGKLVLKVNLIDVYCWAHEGEVHMLHNNILVEPTVITNDKAVAEAKTMGIHIQSAVEQSKTSGVIKFSANPLHFNVQCYFDSREAFLNRVEGEDYYLMSSNDCHMVTDDILNQLKGE